MQWLWFSLAACTAEAISLVNEIAVVDDDKCTECGACVQACANDAIGLVVTAVPVAPGDARPETGEIIHLEARPVKQGGAGVPSTISSGKWLTILGRVAGAVITLLIDRAADVGRQSRTTRYGTGGCSPKRLRRRGRSGR